MSYIVVQDAGKSKAGEHRKYAYLVTNHWNKERGMAVPSRKHLGVFFEELGEVAVSVAIAGHNKLRLPLAELKKLTAKGIDMLAWLKAEGEHVLTTHADVKAPEKKDGESELVKVENAGSCHVFSSLAESTGLKKALEDAFGERDAISLLALSPSQGGHWSFFVSSGVMA